jgi:hypothetical protein
MFVICQVAVQDYSKVAYGSDRNDCLILKIQNVAFQLTETWFSRD